MIIRIALLFSLVCLAFYIKYWDKLPPFMDVKILKSDFGIEVPLFTKTKSRFELNSSRTKMTLNKELIKSIYSSRTFQNRSLSASILVDGKTTYYGSRVSLPCLLHNYETGLTMVCLDTTKNILYLNQFVD